MDDVMLLPLCYDCFESSLRKIKATHQVNGKWQFWGCQNQWCKQDQIRKTKNKTTMTRPRPRSSEVNKSKWRI